jgi:hypothetical protein
MRLMPPGRHVDPGSIAGWLVRAVEQHLDCPDDVLARLTGTTRSRITAARIAATQASTAMGPDRRNATTPGEGQGA